MAELFSLLLACIAGVGLLCGGFIHFFAPDHASRFGKAAISTVGLLFLILFALWDLEATSGPVMFLLVLVTISVVAHHVRVRRMRRPARQQRLRGFEREPIFPHAASRSIAEPREEHEIDAGPDREETEP